MSLRNMEVQYVGDTLYLPPLEREVKHIIVKDEDVKDWKHFEPVVRCRDCLHFKKGEEEPPVDWYVMECTLTVRNGTRTAEFRGFATKEVVETALEIFRGVITNEHCPNCGAKVVSE